MGDYLAHYGVKGMKWGIRHDRRSADRIHRMALKKEPKITKDVQNVVRKNGCQMYGLEHRLKTRQSIARKVDLGKDIKDAVRYTAILPEKSFVTKYEGIKRDLESKGYKEVKCKNYFKQYSEGKVKHKAVQCNYQSKDGYIFEMQFHTKSSQDAKNKKVPLYEEIRDPKTSSIRKGELAAQMVLLAENVKDPDNIFDIKEH